MYPHDMLEEKEYALNVVVPEIIACLQIFPSQMMIYWKNF